MMNNNETVEENDPPAGSSGPSERRDEGAASRFTEREILNDICGSGPDGAVPAIRFVKASYIIKVFGDGKTLPKRQDLPEEAFWDKKVWKKTIIVVVSYPWLSVMHPDPDGFHLATLAPLLSKFTDHLQNQNKLPDGDIAVFIDWVSLFQKHRTHDEQRIFDECLINMTLLYAHSRTVVWCLTKVPSHMNPTYYRCCLCVSYYLMALIIIFINLPLNLKSLQDLATYLNTTKIDLSYGSRGWCVFEYRIASVITTANNLLNLGQLKDAPEKVTDFREQVEKLKSKRKPPLHPDDFQSLLYKKNFLGGFKYKFTNGTDRDVVIDKYRVTFDELLGEVDRLGFSRLGWNDDDVKPLIRSLPKCTSLKSLLLHSNNLGDGAARALCKAFPETLEQLDARFNPLLSFVHKDPYPYGEIDFYGLQDSQKAERVEWRKRYLVAFKNHYSSQGGD